MRTAALILALALPAQAGTLQVAVTLSAGEAEYRALLEPDDSVEYLLTARAGQELHADIGSETGGIGFDVEKGSLRLHDAGAGAVFAGILPEDGGWILRVRSLDGEAAAFRLYLELGQPGHAADDPPGVAPIPDSPGPPPEQAPPGPPAAAGDGGIPPAPAPTPRHAVPDALAAGGPAADPPGAAGIWYRVGPLDGDMLNLRRGPSLSAPVVAQAGEGRLLQGFGCTGGDGLTWCMVAAPDDAVVRGWAAERHLQHADPPVGSD